MITRLKPKSEFNRSILTLIAGTTIAQAISLLIVPILTRLYTPQDYGANALFLSVISILTVVATARYEMAIMLPKSNRAAISIFYLSIFISIFLFITTLIFVSIYKKKLNELLGSEIAILIPFTILVAGISQSLRMWMNRLKKYKEMAINNVEQSLYGGIMQLALGLYNLGSIGLIIGQFIGQIFSTLKLGIYQKKTNLTYINKNIYLRSIASFRRYLYLIKFGVPASLTSRVAQESLILLVGYFISASAAGFIVILNRIIYLPALIFGSNLGDVFYQSISEVPKNKSFPIIKEFCFKLIILSVPMYIILFVAIEYLFVFIFGSYWQGALEYTPYLIVVAIFSFIFSPLSMLFNYYEFQGLNFFWQLTWALSNILVFFIFDYLSLSIQQLFLIYTIKQSVIYLFGIAAFIFYSHKIYEK